MKTLYGIQYLRAVAALAVVLFHSAERAGAHFSIGAAGVDVFFVVSGFIMVVISEKRHQSPAAFLRDRLLRIAPSYWLVTTIMVVGALVGLFPNLTLSTAHLVGSYLFLPVPSPNGGALWPILVQGWTLNYEMFFYLVFASTLMFGLNRRLAALAMVFVLLAVAGFFVTPASPALVFYTRPVILEFLAGALIARFWLRGIIPGPGAGLILVAVGLLAFAGIYVWQLDFNTWICAPLAIMMVTGMLALEKAGRLPIWRPLSYLGDASYSIYLWHTLAISVVLKAATAFALSGWAGISIAALAGVALGIVAYEGIERPLQGLVRHGRFSFRVLGREPAK
ncbi:acyltransferase family protein [Rhizobium oryzicola]|uniref:Acyltransferase n=1 Tax=Rhizobium oryzicola TaxID=1232668 RepID=A0ABT8T0I7_9HYPH|nr:acyltransferase [Rhizobium oryzicola]MDO1584170.1 acyltransferase [Rhizobium oryzicola]